MSRPSGDQSGAASIVLKETCSPCRGKPHALASSARNAIQTVRRMRGDRSPRAARVETGAFAAAGSAKHTGDVEIPDVLYARSGDVSIAYQVVGEQPVDLVFVRGFAGDLLSVWEQPLLVRFIDALSDFARVILIDKRGTGLSDRVREVPTLETRMDDLRAVMDDAGSESAILWTAQEGARLATLFAATHPERVAALVLFDPTAKGRQTEDYPWALIEERWRRLLKEIRDGWGRTEFLEARLAEWSPDQRDDPQFRAWFLADMRRSLSPGSALAFFRMMRDSDVSDVLSSVRIPTIVLSSPSEQGPSEYFARRIAGARLVELPNLRSMPATASSPPSTVRRARSRAPTRSPKQFATSASRSGAECTPASASSSATRSAASRFTSARAWPRLRPPGRCSSPRPYETSWPGRGSSSRSEASTSSRVSPALGGCMPSSSVPHITRERRAFPRRNP